MKPTVTPELTLRRGKDSILDRYRNQCDIDLLFVQRVFGLYDALDERECEKSEEDHAAYLKILEDHPEIFIKNSDVEMSRQDQRVYTHKCLLHYLKKANEIEPLGNVLSNFYKVFKLMYPLSLLRYDCSVKLTVSL